MFRSGGGQEPLNDINTSIETRFFPDLTQCAHLRGRVRSRSYDFMGIVHLRFGKRGAWRDLWRKITIYRFAPRIVLLCGP